MGSARLIQLLFHLILSHILPHKYPLVSHQVYTPLHSKSKSCHPIFMIPALSSSLGMELPWLTIVLYSSHCYPCLRFSLIPFHATRPCRLMSLSVQNICSRGPETLSHISSCYIKSKCLGGHFAVHDLAKTTLSYWSSLLCNPSASQSRLIQGDTKIVLCWPSSDFGTGESKNYQYLCYSFCLKGPFSTYIYLAHLWGSSINPTSTLKTSLLLLRSSPGVMSPQRTFYVRLSWHLAFSNSCTNVLCSLPDYRILDSRAWGLNVDLLGS